ncbi:MAG: TM2 domain-containing protein [Chitinophagales bacterium]|nr:TM2 domain-containing protein [Chitinophagales bacterium]
MEQQKADMFLMMNSKYFDSNHLYAVKEQLLELDDSKASLLSTIQFKDPTVVLIVSLLAGTLGIDRFMIGDTGIGIAKLLTCGGLGIWAIIDLFMIMGATRDKNMQTLQNFINS